MNKYQRGKIYKIVCNQTNKCYIGSTCEPSLARRLSGHKLKYNIYLKTNTYYTTSFEILQNNNYDIVLIENYPCNSKNELHARERHWIETLECVNKVIPKRTRAEYRVATKEHIKQYYQDNREKIRLKCSQPYQCACGNVLTYEHKSRHFKTKKHQAYLISIENNSLHNQSS